LPVKLKGTQKKMAEAAVGTKSLGTMFAAVPDKKQESKQSTNQSLSDVPPRKEES